MLVAHFLADFIAVIAPNDWNGKAIVALISNSRYFDFVANTHTEAQCFRVFHLISKSNKPNIKRVSADKKCLLPKHREVIYQTQEEVFHLISKHREVISNTRRSVSTE